VIKERELLPSFLLYVCLKISTFGWK